MPTRPLPKFRAMYPTDKKNYDALLEDGTFVSVLGKGQNDYEIWSKHISDKRDQPVPTPRDLDAETNAINRLSALATGK